MASAENLYVMDILTDVHNVCDAKLWLITHRCMIMFTHRCHALATHRCMIVAARNAYNKLWPRGVSVDDDAFDFVSVCGIDFGKISGGGTTRGTG